MLQICSNNNTYFTPDAMLSDRSPPAQPSLAKSEGAGGWALLHSRRQQTGVSLHGQHGHVYISLQGRRRSLPRLSCLTSRAWRRARLPPA